MNTPNETASSSKIQHISTNTPKQSDPKITGYRFVDVEILSDMITFLCCPNCKSSGLMLHENFSKKKGFASLLLIKCECGFEKEFYSSQPASAKTHDINRRIIYTMRSIGQGYSSIQKFTALMNMPQPMTQKNYDRSVKVISEVVQDVAEETMADAATELKENQGTNNPDVSVSCDGTWQRRGFSSLNGSFTAISVDSGKILDTEIMSRYCKSCKGKENLKKLTDQHMMNGFQNMTARLTILDQQERWKLLAQNAFSNEVLKNTTCAIRSIWVMGIAKALRLSSPLTQESRCKS